MFLCDHFSLVINYFVEQLQSEDFRHFLWVLSEFLLSSKYFHDEINQIKSQLILEYLFVQVRRFDRVRFSEKKNILFDDFKSAKRQNYLLRFFWRLKTLLQKKKELLL